MSEVSNNKVEFWDKLRNTLLFLSLITSVFAILLSLLGFPDAVSRFKTTVNSTFTADRVQFWINMGNIAVSAFFLGVFLKKKNISVNYYIKRDREYDFCELAEFERYVNTKTIAEDSQKKIERIQIRVGALIRQYIWTVRLFAVSLVLLYLTIVISALRAAPPAENVRLITNFAILTNILNFVGGVFVFLAFWVLYRETLDDREEDNRFWLIPLLLTLAYVVGVVGYSWLYKPGENAYHFLNIVDLIAGSINGLPMLLLFGRYVSLEQALNGTELFRNAFKDLFKPLPFFESEKSYTKLVSFGIIFLLPVYALAQPLFGSLEIKLYGENPKVFQTTVYGICLVGKLCFFHLTFLLVRKKLLQLYLYGLVSQVGNFHKLEECLDTTP